MPLSPSSIIWYRPRGGDLFGWESNRGPGGKQPSLPPGIAVSPLSSHSVGSPDPELPDTTLFATVFPQNFQADISALREYIKDLKAGISALTEFVTAGKAGFSVLRGERVITQSSTCGLTAKRPGSAPCPTLVIE